MSEPLRRVASTDNYVNAAANVRAWRIAFKVTDATYNFSLYDKLELAASDYDFLEDEVLSGNTFYDLCRVKGQYKPYHEDFIQTYFCSLFKNTPFPCNIFVFIEEVTMNNGNMVNEPHELRISAGKQTRKKKALKKKSTENTDVVEPDYEIFYMDSANLNIDAGSTNDLFLSMVSRFMRGSPVQRGNNLFCHNSFSVFTDGRGMEFIRYKGFVGIVPNLPGATTLVPLVILTSRALGYKHSLRRMNKILASNLGNKLRNSHKLMRSGKRHIKDLSFLLYSVEYFLTQSYMLPGINYKNRLAQDLLSHILVNMDVPRDYSAVKEQLEPLDQLLRQLSTYEMIKAQASIRFAIIALGFIMLFMVIAVSAILGVEPILRLLVNLGLIHPNMLR